MLNIKHRTVHTDGISVETRLGSSVAAPVEGEPVAISVGAKDSSMPVGEGVPVLASFVVFVDTCSFVGWLDKVLKSVDGALENEASDGDDEGVSVADTIVLDGTSSVVGDFVFSYWWGS